MPNPPVCPRITSYCGTTSFGERCIAPFIAFSSIQNVIGTVCLRLGPKGSLSFLTGGGGSVEGYQKSVKSGGLNCAQVMNLMLLPKHPKLADFSGTTSDYQRVSVACGLAQDAFSLGQLIPAGQVENDDNPTHIVAERPDRDELYAR